MEEQITVFTISLLNPALFYKHICLHKIKGLKLNIKILPN